MKNFWCFLEKGNNVTFSELWSYANAPGPHMGCGVNAIRSRGCHEAGMTEHG